MIIKHDIFYVGGSGGSFIDSIFLFYTEYQNNPKNLDAIKKKYFLISKRGDCHEGSLLKNPNHYIEQAEKLDKNKKNIAIKFSFDNIPNIQNLIYGKVYSLPEYENEKLKLFKNTRFNEKLIKGDLKKTEIAIKKLYKRHLTEWIEKFPFNKMDLVINFDTIYGKDNNDLNDIISNFLKVEKLKEVDDFIENYRKINNSMYF
jgi:hypothetical protein